MTASEILIYIAFFCAALLCLIAITLHRDFKRASSKKEEAAR